MKLLIVESPTKIKTISKYLGDDYKIVACYGHIRDLSKSNKDAIDIENDFLPLYVSTPARKKTIAKLKKDSSTADEVLIATDPDREGEAIAWHIKETLKHNNIKRIKFNEITSESVTNAINNPNDIDLNLKYAQEARRVLDRLFGYTLSKLIWTKVYYGLSAGRVQSPTLRILVEKEREIKEFKPKEYFIVSCKLRKKQFKDFKVETKRLNENENERLIKLGKSVQWIAENIEKTTKTTTSQPPFITSTLQQSANTFLGFSPIKNNAYSK